MTLKFPESFEIPSLDSYLPQNKIPVVQCSERAQKPTEELSKLLATASLLGIKFDNAQYLNRLKPESLNKIRESIIPKTAKTFFNIQNSYGFKEYARTILEYLRSYGGFCDIPTSAFDIPENVELPEVKVNKTYSFDTMVFFEDIEKILITKKNPNTRDLEILKNLEHAESLDTGIINNRVVLKMLASYELKLRFIPLNAADIRVYIEAKKSIRKRLKTSEKTWIMVCLNNLRNDDVLSNFATNKKFWRLVESEIKPTQTKYNNYPNAQRLFGYLRDNDFSKSSNSMIERLISSGGFKNVVDNCLATKSPQYLIRNLTKIIKLQKPQNWELDALFGVKDLTLKQIFECLRGLESNGVVKVKTKFVKYSKTPLPLGYVNKLKSILNELAEAEFTRKLDDFLEQPKNNEYPEIERPISELKNIAIPTQDDAFFDVPLDKGYITRGSKVPFSQFGIDKGISVFVAWKRKDNTEGELDLDLSARVQCTKENVNYTWLQNKSGSVKHSGDYTFCQAFNPENPLITCEMINIFTQNEKGLVDITLNSWNGVDLKEYDVYVGFSNIQELPDDETWDYEHSYFNLNSAKWLAKITSFKPGFMHLFTIDTVNETILFTGVQNSESVMVPSNEIESKSSLTYEYYNDFLKIPSVLGLCLGTQKLLKKSKDTYNPYKLKDFIDFIINR